jgi:ABC-type amino acid transport substrate-binding protein
MRSMTLVTLLAVLLTAGACASMPEASRGGTLDRIKASKTVTFGYRESSVPFSFVGSDNRSLARLYRSGDIVEIYRQWLGALGAPGALELATWAIEGLPE